MNKAYRPIRLLTTLAAASALVTQGATQTGACRQTADALPAKSAPIPMGQIGAAAGKQYQGDGLSVATTAEGARLRCVFQRLEGEATTEGLWLTSTTAGAKGERFRVVASAVRRDGGETGANEARTLLSAPLPGRTRISTILPRTGKVEVADKLVRFIRPGLVEEYSVCMDGVRQDFLVLERPGGAAQLRVELDVTGAKVEPLAHGARLVLDGSGRKLAYSRLRVTDATGRELPARMEVAPVAAEVTRLESKQESGEQKAEMDQSLTSAATGRRLAVVVQDADAAYPIRIDPTFSDENWISMNPSIPGADDSVYAAVVDGSGNLYIGGWFTVVGEVIANRVAKWDGTSWSALGSGIGGDDSYVSDLALSGSDLYAGAISQRRAASRPTGSPNGTGAVGVRWGRE